MKKILIIIALAFVANVNAQMKSYYIGIDLTEESLIDTYKDKIIKEVGYISNKYADQGIRIILFPITNVAGYTSREIGIPTKSWMDSPPRRKMKADSIAIRVRAELNKSTYSFKNYPRTRIYDNLVKFHGLKDIIVYVFSDLFENYAIQTYDASKLSKLNFKNINFIRGIDESKRTNLQYIADGDIAEEFWKQVIPNVKISQ